MNPTDEEIDETDKELEALLNKHLGHKISLLKVGDTMLELKCLDCNELLGYNWAIIKEGESS